MSHTSCPDSTRSLPNRDLDVDARDENLAVQAAINFVRVRGFEEQLQRFDEIGPRRLDGFTLAGDVEFGAERHIRVVVALDDGRQLLRGRHVPIVVHRPKKRPAG